MTLKPEKIITNPKGIVSEVYNMNCVAGMREYPDGYFDWAVCDIEYGIGASKQAKKPTGVKQKNGNILHVKKCGFAHSDWDFKMSGDEYFNELFRVSKNQIVFGGNYYGLAGGYLIWDKLNGDSDQMDIEMAWLSFTKRTDRVFYLWNGMMQGESISRNPLIAIKQKGDKSKNEGRLQECQKPVILYEWMIKEYGISGRVLDTHLGSGSNRIANYSSGNDFCAFEVDNLRFKNQEQRFQKHISQLTIF